MNIFDFAIDMSTTYSTEWVKLNKYSNCIEKANLCINWLNVTGTLDGTIGTELLISNFGSLNETDYIIQQADSKVIDSASGQHNVIIDAACKAVRLNYTKNNITAGTLKGAILVEGKQ